MTEEQASNYNREQFNLYRAQHPDVYFDEILLGQMGSYFERNSLRIISAAMIANVIERFKEAALLPERPTPTASNHTNQNQRSISPLQLLRRAGRRLGLAFR